MPEIGPMELAVILLIVVMIFGVGKLPEAATSLGKAIKEFKKSSQSTSDLDEETEEPKPKKKAMKTRVKPAAVVAIDAKPEAVPESTGGVAASPVKCETTEAPVHAS